MQGIIHIKNSIHVSAYKRDYNDLQFRYRV
jgi:hypothetical protein